VTGAEQSSNPVSMTKGIARITLKTHSGSYLCGAVRTEVDVDIAEGTKKCNCSSCTKARS
jgi:molybdopterin-binding protein